MFDIKTQHLDMIRKILVKYPYKFFVFGSRVKATSSKFSDLDLAFEDEIPKATIALIREEFEQSNLPYKVDLIDLKTCSEDFKSLIAGDLKLFS